MIGIMLIHFGNNTGLFYNNTIWGKICVRGNLGVEICYIINAFLYVYKRGANTPTILERYKNVLFSVLRLMLLYYLAMLTNYMLFKSECSIFNVASQYLFLNFLLPTWWGSNYFGGTGFVGTLVLMWLIQPLYINKVRNHKDSTIFMFLTFIVGKLLLIFCNNVLMPISNNPDMLYVYVLYFVRALRSFSMGYFIYYIIKEWDISKKTSILIEIACLIWLGLHYETMSEIEITFVIICGALMIAQSKNRWIIITNPLFDLIGRYSWGIFCFHIIINVKLIPIITNQPILWGASIILSIVCSIIVTELIERPILKRLSIIKNH